jgi:hypothetical protein
MACQQDWDFLGEKLVQRALQEHAAASWVSVDILASIVGVWLFGCLLDRHLLSIPHNICQFIHNHRGSKVKWWASARREAIAMARAVTLMHCDMGLNRTPFLFASDAQGAGEGDNGGYGIVGRLIDDKDFQDIMQWGETPGYTVRRLSDFEGSKTPYNLHATVPISMLPDRMFSPCNWKLVGHGRWKLNDHITIGESRAVVKLLKRLSTFTYFHRSLVISLQDNLPTAGSMAKGRSSAYGLLRVLRQKAGTCLAAGMRTFLPWCQSAVQPAYEASRWQ